MSGYRTDGPDDLDLYSADALRTAPGEKPGDVDRSSTAGLEITGHQKCLLLGAIGLTGEAGEVAEAVKKHVFHGHELDRRKLVRELGDVVWYVNYLAFRCLGATLRDVLRENIAKLRLRYPEGHFSSFRSVHRAEGDD